MGMTEKTDEMLSRLDTYLVGLKCRGEKLPTWRAAQKPHIKVISAAANVAYSFLLAQAGKQRISLAVQEIGLMRAKGSQKSRLSEQYEHNCSLLENYIELIRKNGLKLPEDPTHKGQIFFAQLEIEAGLQQSTLTLKGIESDKAYKVRLQQMLKNLSLELGLEVSVLPQTLNWETTTLTYEFLLQRGTQERENKLKGKRSAKQQLYNTRSALKSFIKILDLELTSTIGKELVLNFKQTLAEVLDKLTIDQTSKGKFQTEICRWYDFYQAMVKEQSIPKQFHQALVYLIDRSGLTVSVLAKLTDISREALRQWYYGESTPVATSFPALCKMEELFKLPAGTLVNRVPGRNRRRPYRLLQLPEFLQKDPTLFYRISKYLPDDFCDASHERQREIVASIRAEILRSDDPHTKKVFELQQLPYKLKEWSASLREEFDEFAAYKMMQRPPLGMRRTGRWRVATKVLIEREMGYLFGAICLPTDSHDIRLRGLAATAEDLTLALIACPLLIDWYIKFRFETRSQYTEHAIRLFDCFKNMLQPKTGWLRQMPQLASRLRPISCGVQELVSPELVSKAHTNWEQICDEAIEFYNDMIKEEIQPIIEVARDPFYRIKGIVEMDNPLLSTEVLMRGMEDNMPNQYTQPTCYHLAIRDRALVLLIESTGLRRNTIAQLDFTGDDNGHLYKLEKKYILNIPRRFFKEENSPYFGAKNAQTDYYMELPDIYGFYDLLDEYLNTSRLWLLEQYHPECKDHPLFVASLNRSSARMVPTCVSRRYSEAVTRYLVENKWRGTGYSEVKKHYSHSARHKRGTGALKITGSYQIVADTNHTSIKTAQQHYTKYEPKERNKRVNEALYGVKG
jgi:integrase/transcriptional regulator with XRE-family HTH domain